MAYSLTWLPAVLESAGLKVALVSGWEGRGRADAGQVLGVICHHTAGPPNGNMPSLNTLIQGRSNLRGPLAQLGLGRDGTYYVIAAGKCNHAGEGSWKGLTRGNTNFIGIEAEHTGKPNDSWPPIQMQAYARGVAAVLRHAGRSAEFCAGHREYALPPGRKPDPSFDMVGFRQSVAAILSGADGPPVLIPAIEPAPTARPTLRRGAVGELVNVIQRETQAPVVNGSFDAATEAAVRQFQRAQGLVPDGIVGPKTWAVLDTI